MSAAPTPQPAPPRTLAAWAAAQIRDQILAGRLAPGQRIYEQELARALQVSRTPVREALRQLQREQLVTVYPNRETVITTHTAVDVREIYQLRAALEGMAARLAATADRAAVVPDLFATVARMHEAIDRGDYHELLDLDMAFHDVILRGAGNGRLAEAVLHVRAQTRRYLSVPLYFPATEQYALSLTDHRTIAEAVRDGEPDLAERRMRTHIVERGEYIARVVASGAWPTAADGRSDAAG